MSDLVGNPEDRFSRVAAHTASKFNISRGIRASQGTFSCFLKILKDKVA